MKVPRHIVAQAIAEKTLHIKDDKQLAQEIAAYLLVERRTSELESIIRDIMQYRMDHGVLEAEVVTAHPVGKDVLQHVEQLLQTAYPDTKHVQVSSHVEPTVIGGIRVDMANAQLDMTVGTKLATFKRLTSEKG
jgi:F0F1-type ATP synthase delta subunit